MRKARDSLAAAWLRVSGDSSSPVNSRLWTQRRAEFREKVSDINVKVDRLNMIVPTLYQQIAHFDKVKEEKTVIEQTQQAQPTTPHQQTTTDNSQLTLTDVWRQLKALFTS